MLREILRLGGDITRPNSNGSTDLHFAVCEGNIEIVKLLLDQGASVDKPDEHGWTATDLAEQQGHEDIQLLFESQKEITTLPVALGLPSIAGYEEPDLHSHTHVLRTRSLFPDDS